MGKTKLRLCSLSQPLILMVSHGRAQLLRLVGCRVSSYRVGSSLFQGRIATLVFKIWIATFSHSRTHILICQVSIRNFVAAQHPLGASLFSRNAQTWYRRPRMVVELDLRLLQIDFVLGTNQDAVLLSQRCFLSIPSIFIILFKDLLFVGILLYLLPGITLY